jgi:hypothetical protein
MENDTVDVKVNMLRLHGSDAMEMNTRMGSSGVLVMEC